MYTIGTVIIEKSQPWKHDTSVFGTTLYYTALQAASELIIALYCVYGEAWEIVYCTPDNRSIALQYALALPLDDNGPTSKYGRNRIVIYFGNDLKV